MLSIKTSFSSGTQTSDLLMQLTLLLLCGSHHDQIDQWDSVEADVPQPHDTEHVDEDHGDGDADQRGRPQLEAKQNRRDHKYGGQWDAEVQGGVVGNGEVLLVKDVEDAGIKRQVFTTCEYLNCFRTKVQSALSYLFVDWHEQQQTWRST